MRRAASAEQRMGRERARKVGTSGRARFYRVRGARISPQAAAMLSSSKVTLPLQVHIADVDRARVVRAAQRDLAAIAELARGIWRKHSPAMITLVQIYYMLELADSLDP